MIPSQPSQEEHQHAKNLTALSHKHGKFFIEYASNMVTNMEENILAKCPKCGTEVANPRKKWKMAGRADRTGKKTELTIGLYDCPKCGAFRKVLEKRKI